MKSQRLPSIEKRLARLETCVADLQSETEILRHSVLLGDRLVKLKTDMYNIFNQLAEFNERLRKNQHD